MKKTKHFNISVPELGDVPDITQVSNAISDLEDATAGTLEIMKAEMQGTKITLTSVSRKTKRTGYYEGMSIRFKSPQDIEPNYLKTISVDGLGDQELSVAYKVNRNEYIDIVYEGNKFTAYPVVVQKTDSVSNNSSILVGTAKGVKTAYDKGVEALNKANQAQTTADGKVSKSGDTMTGVLTVKAGGITISHDSNPALRVQSQDGRTYLGFFGYDNDNKNTSVSNEKANISLRLYDNGNAAIDANNLTTNSKEVVTAINELNSNKINKYGDVMTGPLTVVNTGPNKVIIQHGGSSLGALFANEVSLGIYNEKSDKYIRMNNDGTLNLGASNLITENKDVVEVINDCVNFTKSGGDYWYQGYSKSFEGLSVDEFLKNRKTGFFNSNKTSPGYYPYGRHDYKYYFVNSHSNSSGYAGIIAMDFHGESMGFKTIVDGRANKWNELAHFEDGNLKQCPFPVGFVMCTTKKENPSAIWTGTVWHEIRDRFLYSSSTAEPTDIGGSNSITLSVSQLPPHNHGIDYARRHGRDGQFDYGYSGSVDPNDADYNDSDTVGDGSPIDITPAFYSVKMWVRMS